MFGPRTVSGAVRKVPKAQRMPQPAVGVSPDGFPNGRTEHDRRVAWNSATSLSSGLPRPATDCHGGHRSTRVSTSLTDMKAALRRLLVMTLGCLSVADCGQPGTA